MADSTLYSSAPLFVGQRITIPLDRKLKMVIEVTLVVDHFNYHYKIVEVETTSWKCT